MTRALSNIRHPARRYITRKIVRRAMPLSCQGIGISARKSGFVKRASTLKPVKLFQAMVETAGAGGEFSIAGIQRRHGELSGDDIRCKPFHNRIRQDEFVDFMMCNTARLQEHVMRVSSLNDGRQLLAMHTRPGLTFATCSARTEPAGRSTPGWPGSALDRGLRPRLRPCRTPMARTAARSWRSRNAPRSGSSSAPRSCRAASLRSR